MESAKTNANVGQASYFRNMFKDRASLIESYANSLEVGACELSPHNSPEGSVMEAGSPKMSVSMEVSIHRSTLLSKHLQSTIQTKAIFELAFRPA